MLPQVTQATIDTIDAQTQKEFEHLDYVSKVGQEMDINQPFLKRAIVGSVQNIMEDMERRNINKQDRVDIAVSMLSLSYLIFQSVQAQVEVQELEEMSI